MHKDCPVCQSTLSPVAVMAQYNGIDYRLCSKQCRHNFQRRPHLYIGYADGTKSVKQQGLSYIKQRTIQFDDPIASEEQQRIESCLEAMKGIRDFKVLENAIYVEYDLLEVSEQQIEYRLEKLQVSFSHRFIDKMKRAFIHFSEQNELDNAAAHLPCCNKRPIIKASSTRSEQ